MRSIARAIPFTMLLLAFALLVEYSLLRMAAIGPAPIPVYSVAAVRAEIIHSPGTWIGRTVRIHAKAHNACVAWTSGTTAACKTQRPVFLDPASFNVEAGLLVNEKPLPAVLAELAQLPLISQLLPTPQQIQWRTLATYRVRLSVAPPSDCDTPPCYEGLLLDAGQ
jgi:hypothetical protein